MKTQKKYFYTQHIYGCHLDDHIIILDTCNDIYYLFSHNDVKIILEFTHTNFTIHDIKSVYSGIRHEYPPLIRRMISDGILTESEKNGKILSAPAWQRPKNFSDHIQCDDWPKISWVNIFFLVMSDIYTQFIMKFMGFNKLIIKLKKDSLNKNLKEYEGDPLRIARIYHRIRPILFKRKICLYDTIVLFYFCKFHGIDINIIFGVSAEPFQAHCWAQSGDMILNDSPQNLKQYTPIMAI